MSFEVVYTSSPKGLKEGNRGFCTVAATSGIPRPLHEKLESLSGYRHAFTAPSKLNPVNYSYLIVRIQNERYYVLSRIADAGIDFSGRTNKIAHHLALSATDLRKVNSTPNALLSDPAFWFTAWDRKPQTLPAGRLPSSHKAGKAGCQTWKKVFGDPGWAGLLARAVRHNQSPAWLIVPPGANSLALLDEAMRLVSPQERWKICFSTYFTRMTAGSECHWRFVLEESEEAEAVRARPTGVLVDPLRSHQDLPDDDPFVEAARNGDASGIQTATRARSAQREQATSSRRPVTRSQLRRRQAGARARQARLAASRRPVAPREYIEEPLPEPVEPVKQSRGKFFWASVAAGTLVLGGAIYLAVHLLL